MKYLLLPIFIVVGAIAGDTLCHSKYHWAEAGSRLSKLGADEIPHDDANGWRTTLGVILGGFTGLCAWGLVVMPERRR